MFFKPGTGLCRAAALPDNGMIEGFGCPAVPYDSGLTLIGNADGCNGLGINAGLCHCLTDNSIDAVPDLLGIMFNPAGLGIILLEFLVGAGNHPALGIKNKRPGTRRTLINRKIYFFINL